jgi:uncharacterized cupin superfamily protein
MEKTERRHPNVINLRELPGNKSEKGSRFAYTSKQLAFPAGGKGIGASWYEQPPGKTAFPTHFHTANEESLFVLAGNGTVHIGSESVPIGPGDYVTFPVGPDHAHRVVNTGTEPLQYLCFSTLIPVEIVGYPDSKKIGVRAGEPGRAFTNPWVRHLFKTETAVDYYQGETID